VEALKILITAYACQPGAGSEPGHGWNYPSGLAKRGHEVHALVPLRWRQGVDDELRLRPIENLTFHFVGERDWPMRMGWTAGSTLRYFLWQWDCARAAAVLDQDHDFDILHHVSYGTLLGGSFLWRVGKPFVFGPVGGGQTAPPGFAAYFGKFWAAEALRTLTIKVLWRLDWPALRAVRSATIVLASNRETAALASRMGARRVENMLSVYLPDQVIPAAPPSRDAYLPIRLLWVGRMLGRKAMRLTVEAVDRVPKDVPIELEMIGGGPLEDEFRHWLSSAQRTHPVHLRGTLPWQAVHEAYERADLFIFTSLRDTVGIQLLEAMAHGLPVVTLDHQGAAELVPEAAGIKVAVTSPDEVAQQVAAAIERLAASADLRERMGAAGYRRAREFVLSERIVNIEGAYATAAVRVERRTAQNDR
jgi:glycosyltransferase involved in cell wall biosynthesis